jgi:hypothetical protein
MTRIAWMAVPGEREPKSGQGAVRWPVFCDDSIGDAVGRFANWQFSALWGIIVSETSRGTRMVGMDRGDGLGRFVFDIDGCLRSTDRALLTPEEVIALHGRLASEAAIALEGDGGSRWLRPGERVSLEEATVAFFRSRPAEKWTCAGATSTVPLGR